MLTISLFGILVLPGSKRNTHNVIGDIVMYGLILESNAYKLIFYRPKLIYKLIFLLISLLTSLSRFGSLQPDAYSSFPVATNFEFSGLSEKT